MLGMPEHLWKSILDTLIPATSNNREASKIIVIEELVTDMSYISDMKRLKLFSKNFQRTFQKLINLLVKPYLKISGNRLQRH